MLAVEVANIQMGCGNVGMGVGVVASVEVGGCMIIYPATSTHNHSVSDCSGDW